MPCRTKIALLVPVFLGIAITVLSFLLSSDRKAPQESGKAVFLGTAKQPSVHGDLAHPIDSSVETSSSDTTLQDEDSWEVPRVDDPYVPSDAELINAIEKIHPLSYYSKSTRLPKLVRAFPKAVLDYYGRILMDATRSREDRNKALGVLSHLAGVQNAEWEGLLVRLLDDAQFNHKALVQLFTYYGNKRNIQDLLRTSSKYYEKYLGDKPALLDELNDPGVRTSKREMYTLLLNEDDKGLGELLLTLQAKVPSNKTLQETCDTLVAVIFAGNRTEAFPYLRKYVNQLESDATKARGDLKWDDFYSLSHVYNFKNSRLWNTLVRLHHLRMKLTEREAYYLANLGVRGEPKNQVSKTYFR